uniref:SPRY-associated domain-containing protein n=1 Tax=Paramormyrops kingsleyae TaxID=1676925 RepID=A0A3B3S7H5_9TELE
EETQREEEQRQEAEREREEEPGEPKGTQAVEDSERIFTEIIRSIERRSSEVTKLIIDQVKAAVSQAEGHMEILEKDIDELKRRHSELEQLSHTEDHIHLLQKCQGLPVTPQAEFGHKISVYPCCSLENVRKEVSKLKDQLENVYQNIIFRSFLLSDSCQLTLDPNTINNNLHLSEGNRVVTWKRETESYPDHRERFDSPNVLCRESLTGCCYWEVDWSGTMVGIAVAYKGISRKGWDDDSWLGRNDKHRKAGSWGPSALPG